MVDLLLIALALAAALAWPVLWGMFSASGVAGRLEVGRFLSRARTAWSDEPQALRPAAYRGLRCALGATPVRPTPWRCRTWTPPRRAAERSCAWACVEPWLNSRRRTSFRESISRRAVAAWPG
jgi:hypothetical protein